MDYRILGPLEVCDGDRRLELGGEKQRALLALLLLHSGEVVQVDRLIDDLWGERPPPGAPKALQAHVSRLRKALDCRPGASPETDGYRATTSSADVLVTRGHGYMLRVAPGELDLERFRSVVEEGRQALAAGDPAQAAERLRAGLALWRGPPLADFTYETFAQAPIADLEELRLGAVEARIEADLALGRHDQLVGELAALVRQNPLRERLRMQLMLALYRCGREAEALDAYQEYRRGLGEELGLDPSPRLQELETAILHRDPWLELPRASPGRAEVAASVSPLRRTVRARQPKWLAFGGLVVIAVAVVAVVLSGGNTAASPAAIAGNSVGAINPADNEINAVVPVGSSPSSAAVGAGALWVANYSDDTVSRIDPATHAVQTIQAGATPSGIAVGGGAVWVANNLGGSVSRIDPTVNRVVQTITVGNGPSGVAVGDGSVWVTNSSDGTLGRIDAVTGAVRDTIALGGGATGVAAGLGGVWVTDEANGRVLRVDPQTDQVTQAISVGNGPGPITVDSSSVWVANSLDGTVSRIDPQTNQVTSVIPVGQGPAAIVPGAGGVWVANEFAGSVARIDPATDTARTIKVGNRPQALATTGGLVWVGSGAAGRSHRGGTLTAVGSVPLGSLDPAQAYQPAATSLTNDGLTAFKRVGGSDGAQVVPDLATSLPTPTNAGSTYTFQLRRGVRYSNGAPVRPEDFRRAIERDFKLSDALAPAYYANLLGGRACVAHPSRCDLARGIVADDVAGTVTFHLVAPDPELVDRLAVWDAVAIPAGTPNHDVGLHPIPATGAWEVASATPSELRLARNPYFHEWSRAARPDAYPDNMVVRLGASPSQELTAVERGSADYTADGPPPARLGEVQTRFASQLHIDPGDNVDELVLNTSVPPFNDLRVRQALNYAVDRAEIARLVGAGAEPTCQFLPPYIAGYKRYCPYTQQPDNSGVWRRPDLAAAERLIATSHTRGTPVTVWSLGIGGDESGVGQYIVSLLDRMGYPTRLRNPVSDNNSADGRFADSRTKAQVAVIQYFPNYPAPSEYIKWFLSCQNFIPESMASPNWAEFCDPALDAQIGRAVAAEGTNSPGAPGVWAKADRIVTDQAPLVPLVDPTAVDFVSRRVGNYQYNPQLGVLLDQLWVR
jgi:YVTN family beta-propeller protein